MIIKDKESLERFLYDLEHPNKVKIIHRDYEEDKKKGLDLLRRRLWKMNTHTKST